MRTPATTAVTVPSSHGCSGLEVVEENSHSWGTVLRLQTPTEMMLSIVIGIDDHEDTNSRRITSNGHEVGLAKPLWA